MPNQELEQKNIIISGIETLDWGIKITDEKGLKYNVPEFKKGTEEKTIAYKFLASLPKMGLNLNKCIKFISVPNSQGSQSRYVRIITEPIDEQGQTKYISPAIKTPQNEVRLEKIDWDKISWGKCKHAYLVESFKALASKSPVYVPSEKDFNTIEKSAERWADMSMRRSGDLATAQKISGYTPNSEVELKNN